MWTQLTLGSFVHLVYFLALRSVYILTFRPKMFARLIFQPSWCVCTLTPTVPLKLYRILGKQLQMSVADFCPSRLDAPTAAQQNTKSSCVQMYYNSCATSIPPSWSRTGGNDHRMWNGFTLSFLQAKIRRHYYCPNGYYSKHTVTCALFTVMHGMSICCFFSLIFRWFPWVCMWVNKLICGAAGTSWMAS